MSALVAPLTLARQIVVTGVHEQVLAWPARVRAIVPTSDWRCAGT